MLFAIAELLVLYGFEVFLIKKSELNFLDFSMNLFLMKLFWTDHIKLVKSCQSYKLSFNLPSVLLKNRAEKFDIKYNNHADLLCQMVKYL